MTTMKEKNDNNEGDEQQQWRRRTTTMKEMNDKDEKEEKRQWRRTKTTEDDDEENMTIKEKDHDN